MGNSLDFSWLGDAIKLIGAGAAMTILLVVVTAFLGTLLSILGALGRTSRYPMIRRIVKAYVELIRNTPFLAQLFFIFFGLPSLGIRLDPIVAAILAMTINLAAYGTEIVAAGPRGGANRSTRGCPGIGAEAPPRFREDRATAGAEDHFPGADQSDRDHDAQIGRGFSDLGSRAHL